MEDKEAYGLAIELMARETKALEEYAQRYENEPDVWPGLKGRHTRYVKLVEAINILEAKTRQTTLFDISKYNFGADQAAADSYQGTEVVYVASPVDPVNTSDEYVLDGIRHVLCACGHYISGEDLEEGHKEKLCHSCKMLDKLGYTTTITREDRLP